MEGHLSTTSTCEAAEQRQTPEEEEVWGRSTLPSSGGRRDDTEQAELLWISAVNYSPHPSDKAWAREPLFLLMF